MAQKGIDLSTCPAARVVGALCSPAEMAFAATLKLALRSKVLILLKVRVLDVIQLVEEPDKRKMFFWKDVLGDQHFDYVICSKQTIAPLLAVELEFDTGRLPRGAATRTAAKTTAARRAQFPLIRIAANAGYSPELLRKKLIADYQLAKSGPLPAEMV